MEKKLLKIISALAFLLAVQSIIPAEKCHGQWMKSANTGPVIFDLIQDESLCAVYTREFEEMWGSHTDLPDASRAKSGPAITNNTPRIVNVAGTRMEVYFVPTDSISDSICCITGNLRGIRVYPNFRNLSR